MKPVLFFLLETAVVLSLLSYSLEDADIPTHKAKRFRYISVEWLPNDKEGV